MRRSAAPESRRRPRWRGRRKADGPTRHPCAGREWDPQGTVRGTAPSHSLRTRCHGVSPRGPGLRRGDGQIMDLTVAWAFIIAFAVAMYVVMDGFDLGIGI